MPSGDVVLVTGGAGFLGQHIVKHLQLKTSDVSEIKVFDIVPYINKLGHDEPKPVRTILGDIRKLGDLLKAFDEVDCVIHTASLVSVSTFPDKKGMQAINVKGTKNVIEACQLRGVARLIYTSSVEVVSGFDDILYGDETLPYPPTSKLVFREYGETKQLAEKLVLAANGTKTNKDHEAHLHSISLRPTAMYGEQDGNYVTSSLRSAKKRGGVLIKTGDGSAKVQPTYVGNVAWAHVLASAVLKTQPKKSGNVFFVTDDTPPTNNALFTSSFLKPRGYRLGPSIPYPLIYYIFVLVEFFLWIIRPLHEINLATSTSKAIHYVNMTQLFKRSKIEKELGYRPIYDYKESMEKSLHYYTHVNV